MSRALQLAEAAARPVIAANARPIHMLHEPKTAYVPGVVSPGTRGAVSLAVVVAALGYFVDIYDLILFARVRTRSVTDLGVSEQALKDEGIYLFDMQGLGRNPTISPLKLAARIQDGDIQRSGETSADG
jgi:hypothetical protein